MSKVQFPRGTNKTIWKDIFDILQITPTHDIGVYLGCLTVDHKRNKADFEESKNKLSRKLVVGRLVCCQKHASSYL